MRSVEETLAGIGIAELTKSEMSDIADKYAVALRDGLEGKSELPMVPSYLDPVAVESIPEGVSALVIEMGGSNLYGGIVSKTDGKIVVTDSCQAPLPTRVYESAQHYFETVGDLLSPLLDNAHPRAVGIVYSWAGISVKKEVGNDVIIDSKDGKLAKEFYIPGIGDLSVGESIKKYLGPKYPYLQDAPTTIMNDVIAVILSCGASVSGVVATGFNMGLVVPSGAVNSESALFKSIPQTNVSKAVDAESNRPGRALAEKQISGLYLPEHFKIGIKALKEEGYEIDVPEQVDAGVMSAYVQKESPNEQEQMYATVAKIIFARSAQAVGVMIGSAIKTFHNDLEGEVEVPFEGSLFWGAPEYSSIATEVARGICEKQIKCVHIENAGRLGAGVAALGTLIK